jgi:glycosyltransferase involved in cell wall biosynthesis
MNTRTVVVISDFQDGWPQAQTGFSVEHYQLQWANGFRGSVPDAAPLAQDCIVRGGYLERLPLALVCGGFADRAEIWSHWRAASPPPVYPEPHPFLTRRSFQMNGGAAPFASNDMLAHIRTFGPPAILCVWGLGVSEEILLACADSYKIYNSIDAPALRIPPEVSRHFDLVITGAQWQSDEVLARHPGMQTIVLPIGPEFASEVMFRPLGGPKPYDVVYVAAAQGYKRHYVLFDALEKLPRSIRALCVFGYGDQAAELRREVDDRGLDVDFVGPPGVPIEDVNRLMNQAKIGVVCGVDDGAPAILTEYMLAGLPVLANSALRCGLQYITPQTGMTASAPEFHLGIETMLARLGEFSPRQTVLDNWTWPHSIAQLRPMLDRHRPARPSRVGTDHLRDSSTPPAFAPSSLTPPAWTSR